MPESCWWTTEVRGPAPAPSPALSPAPSPVPSPSPSTAPSPAPELGVELIGVPLAESVEFETFADTVKFYLLSAFLISAFS